MNESIKKIINESVKERVDEVKYNRLIHWLKNHECAFITAFRNNLKDVVNPKKTYWGPKDRWYKKDGPDADGVWYKFNYEENHLKNKLLWSKCVSKGFGVIKVKGVYPEGMTDECSEESYMVFNKDDKEGFLETMLNLGELFNQDSIYYKPSDSEAGYLIGTNGADFPGYHKKGDKSVFKLDTASNFMSRLGNTDFAFVGDDAIENNDRAEAMDQINQERAEQGYENQHYWKGSKSNFRSRKADRMKKESNERIATLLIESNCKFMTPIEEMHPLTRMSMGQFLNKNLKNYKI